MRELTRAMKDSGIEWIGEIPEDWGVRKLGNISKLYIGNSIKDNQKDNYVDSKDAVPYIATKDISFDNSVNYENGMYIKRNDINFNRAYKDSTLICIEGGSAGRKIVKIEREVCFGNKLCCIKSNSILNKYIYYYSLSPNFNNGFKSRITGLIPGVTLGEMGQIEVVIPPQSQQKAIADFLDKKVSEIDNIISKTKKVIEEYKKYKQSLITETVTKGLDKNIPMKDSGIEWIGEIPEHWEVVRLKYLFKIKKDTANKLGYNVLSVTQKGLKIRDLKSNEGQLSMDYSKYQIVQKNEFVMNHMDLLTGWVDLSLFDGVTSPDYRVFNIIGNESYNSKYYLYLLQLCYKNKVFYGFGQGVSNLGRWRLQTDAFNNIKYPIPPLQEQKAIASYLDQKCTQIDQIIHSKQQLLLEMEKYKKSLIYEIVTGKREIK